MPVCATIWLLVLAAGIRRPNSKGVSKIVGHTRRNAVIGLSRGLLVAPVLSSSIGAAQDVATGIVRTSPHKRDPLPRYVSGSGQFILANDGAWIEGVGPYGSMVVGVRPDASNQAFQPLHNGLKRGSAILQPADISGYTTGQIVLIVAGRSRNSSPGNSIPKRRQFLSIIAVDSNAGRLFVSSPIEFDADPTDNCFISRADAAIVSNSTIQDLRLGSHSSAEVIYSHSVNFAYVVSIRDVIIDGAAASGFVANADHVVYDNVVFTGYSGISCARGTRRAVWRDCSYAPRARSAEGYAAFLEESPESVLVQNYRARGGQIKVTNCADVDVRKNILIRDLDLEFDGVSVRAGATINTPSIEIAFAAAGGSLVCIEGGLIHGPGGAMVAPGKSIPRCAAYIYGSRHVKLAGLRFTGLAPDAYAIAVDGSNSFELDIIDCIIADGSGRGLCHPSVLTNMNSAAVGSTMCRMKRLEIGLASGRVLVTWRPELGDVLCEWPAGPSRPVGRFPAKSHHRISIDAVAGARGSQRDISAELQISGGIMRDRGSGKALAPDAPLQLRSADDDVELWLTVAPEEKWRGAIRWYRSIGEDGVGFSLS